MNKVNHFKIYICYSFYLINKNLNRAKILTNDEQISNTLERMRKT